MKNIGITFDEACFLDDILYGVNSLIEIGFQNYEFAADKSILKEKSYRNLLSELIANNCDFSFHVPNFLPKRRFNPCFIKSDYLVKKEYEEQLLFVSELIEQADKKVYVVHGSEFEVNSGDCDLDSVKFFIDYLSNLVISRNLPLKISLENAFSKNKSIIPSTLKGAQSIIDALNGYPVGIII